MEAINVKATRDALMEASIALSSATHHHLTEDDAKDCLAVVETAISAPPRNCDVGTPLEQYKRFDKICSAKVPVKDCPLFEKTSPCCSPLCLARWAQMPYEAVNGCLHESSGDVPPRNRMTETREEWLFKDADGKTKAVRRQGNP